jgi:hypothetical protein
VPLGLAPSFGFGDRLGLATPGHVAALRRAGAGILPIFAQQSIREMARTSRTPARVMAEACRGAAAAGYAEPMGADADHLKTAEDVRRTAAAGFVFFTLDPSDVVSSLPDRASESDLRVSFETERDFAAWVQLAVGKTHRLSTGTVIEFTEAACIRAGVKYGRAAVRTVELAREVETAMAGEPNEIELSVDETPQPTSLVEHWLIAEHCLAAGVKLVSLAPRFVGDFEKGVDYKGDLDVFRRSLTDHAAIAAELGPYKLSLHSGSDKLSIYPDFARLTGARFHVKTAGASYMEALRVVARREPALFRRLVTFARERYDADRATYHVSAHVGELPPPEAVPDDRVLEQTYLERWEDVPSGRGFTAPGRQILHCTFGSVLGHGEYGPALRGVLDAHPRTYAELLEEHFARHLDALKGGM